jgi:hypothetical protein
MTPTMLAETFNAQRPEKPDASGRRTAPDCITAYRAETTGTFTTSETQRCAATEPRHSKERNLARLRGRPEQRVAALDATPPEGCGAA